MDIHKTKIYSFARQVFPKWLKKLISAFLFAFWDTKSYFYDLRHYIRIQKPIVRLFGREWKTNLDIIDLVITYDCNLKCFDCNLVCGQAPSKESLSLDQINKFIKESVSIGKKWKMITLMGGEPLIHPDFLEILDLIINYKKIYSPNTIIRVLTNGFGPQVSSVLAKIPQEIQIINSHKTSPANERFICFTNAPIDCPAYKNADFSCGCLRTAQCGISLNKYGYYPCCVAGAIDRIFGFNKGMKKLPDKTDPEIIKSLELFCKYCGGFLYSGHKKSAGYASPTWRQQLLSYKNKSLNFTNY